MIYYLYVALGLSIAVNLILWYFASHNETQEINPSIFTKQLKELMMAIQQVAATLKAQVDATNLILERLSAKSSDLKAQLAAAQQAAAQAQADLAAANSARDQLVAQAAADEASLNDLVNSVQTNTSDAQQLDSVLSS